MSSPLFSAPCSRCLQVRPLYEPRPEWGDEWALFCVRCWSVMCEARENSTYVDFHDAFNNASDEELTEIVFGK